MATLKISDISVGDWVGVRCGTKINAFKVEEIRFNNIIHKYVALLNNKAYGLPTTELHPIPITAEILEKNGFGKKTFTQDQLLRIVEPNGNVPFICYRWDSERVIIERSNDYMLRVKTKYIHQLQHALRLAGIDKEINL